MNWRHRLARWLVGPFFQLPETGSWMVHRDAEADFTLGIRVAEWRGTLRSDVPAIRELEDADDLRTREWARSYGEFSGRFA